MALFAQVPHHMIMLTTFGILNQSMKAEGQEVFHTYDEVNVFYKLGVRFGAVTCASVLATAICYPFDTVKRRIQMLGTPGFQKVETTNELKYMSNMLRKEGVRAFYKGFTVGVLSRVPMAILQYSVYQNLTRAKNMATLPSSTPQK